MSTAYKRNVPLGLLLLCAIIATALVGVEHYAQAAVKTYKSCAELNKAFKSGVANSSKFINRGAGPISKPTVSVATFKKNQKLIKTKMELSARLCGPRQ